MGQREYIYYQGCAQESTAKEYDESLKLVMKSFDVVLKEPDDWSCCGSTPAHTVDDVLAAALAARNLAIVEKMGGSSVTTPCPACLTALKKAHLRMNKEEAFKEEVNSLLDEAYEGSVHPKSNLQVIYEDIGLDEIAAKATHEMPDLKVAPYYGCIMTRPPEVAQFDDPENPVSMDRVLKACGVEVVDFAFKMECCGAAFGLTKREMVNQLSYKVLSMAIDAGANCIAVACPLCQQNLDLRQDQINRTMGTSVEIPVLYFTQIMGLAFGYSPKELGIDKVIVSPDSLIRSRRVKEKNAEPDGAKSAKGKAAAKAKEPEEKNEAKES
ncbi:MAG: CoB--CoM heterodisulfide reductase iron-sulfur subunit B family protein [Syntrophorhabdus sp.]